MKKSLITLPSKANLQGRTSTITNAFAHSIDIRTAEDSLTEEEYKSMLNELGIEEEQCAYCLSKNSGKSVDHLHPIISNKLPSGYFTEKNNLIPCCPSCNSKKGGKDYNVWMKDEKTIEYLKRQKGLSDVQIEERVRTINAFMERHPATCLDCEQILGKDGWDEFKQNIKALNEQLMEMQKYCDQTRLKILDYYKNNNKD